MKLAVPRLKHSPRFGQRASSHTVWSDPSRSSTRMSRAPGARGDPLRAQGGSRRAPASTTRSAPFARGGTAALTLLLDDVRLELVVVQAGLDSLGVGAVAVDADAHGEEPTPAPGGRHRVRGETARLEAAHDGVGAHAVLECPHLDREAGRGLRLGASA